MSHLDTQEPPEMAAPIDTTPAVETTEPSTLPLSENQSKTSNAAEPEINVPKDASAQSAPATIQIESTKLETPRESASAIEPHTDEPPSEAKEPELGQGPSLTITLLLVTGSRHPFKLDEKYLKRRSVNVVGNDPFNMSVYTLKEAIWREWREEWEPRPSSPSSIRLIHFGKLLDDKIALRETEFTQAGPNVVHMTIKPQEIVDEEDAKANKAGYMRDRDGSERSPGCRCVII